MNQDQNAAESPDLSEELPSDQITATKIKAAQMPFGGAERELLFENLANSIQQLCWICDATGEVVWRNRRWQEFTGVTLEDVASENWKKLYHPDYIDDILAHWQVALRDEKPFEFTFPLRGRDGEYGWFLSRATPMRDAAGQVTHWFGTHTDITQERQVSAALSLSRARKAAILESALDCIIVIDHQSRVTEWNPAAVATFGYSRAEAVGQIMSDLIIPHALRQAHLRGFDHYIKTGEGPILGQRLEVPALHADGHEFPIELAITPILTDGPPSFSAYLRDISARKASELELAAHAQLANLSAEVGLALNRSDVLDEILQSCAGAIVEHLDAAFARIWTLNELENVLELRASAGLYTHLDGPHSRVPVGKFKIGLIAQERKPHLTNHVVGDPRVGDQEWARAEGLISFAGYPLLVENRLMGVMAMFARHTLSEDTLRSLATVADAVALGVKRKRAESDLERAKVSAEQASRAKSLFLANMSHELRTPLNAILGYSEMLEEEAVDQGLDEFAPDLGKINSAGKHLLALINDILDLSKIEAGKMELWVENFATATVGNEVAATTQPLFVKGNNRLEVNLVGDLGTMRADVTKVRQCLLNLLSNAAKFTKDGVVSLTVKRQSLASLDSASLAAAPDGPLDLESPRDWLFFEVRDSGIGMSAEQVLKLFQAFTQADASTTRQFGGTGLGLALTRSFCQLMGGDVTVQSAPGQGSTFTLKIPASIDEPASGKAEDVAASVPEPDAPEAIDAADFEPGTTVLVIDDDATQRDLMRRFLTREGFPVQTAASGEEGLALARQICPIAITLDVMMPGLDGWSVLTALKADEQLRDVPVIMLTMVDDKNRGYALGAADYATKPVDRARLGQILQKYACPNPPCPVLLVEDDTVTRQMMRAMLEREGWEVSEAANGREALERVAEQKPNLILLDLMMPEMDGFDCAAALHRNSEWRSIPIVVLTAKDLSEADRLRLSGTVQKVLQKSGQSRTELMKQVRDLVAECAVPKKRPFC